MADYSSNFRHRHGCLFNILCYWWILMWKFGLKISRTVQSIFRYLELFRRNSRVWQTNRRTTDRRTDGRTRS